MASKKKGKAKAKAPAKPAPAPPIKVTPPTPEPKATTKPKAHPRAKPNLRYNPKERPEWWQHSLAVERDSDVKKELDRQTKLRTPYLDRVDSAWDPRTTNSPQNTPTHNKEYNHVNALRHDQPADRRCIPCVRLGLKCARPTLKYSVCSNCADSGEECGYIWDPPAHLDEPIGRPPSVYVTELLRQNMGSIHLAVSRAGRGEKEEESSLRSTIEPDRSPPRDKYTPIAPPANRAGAGTYDADCPRLPIGLLSRLPDLHRSPSPDTQASLPTPTGTTPVQIGKRKTRSSEAHIPREPVAKRSRPTPAPVRLANTDTKEDDGEGCYTLSRAELAALLGMAYVTGALNFGIPTPDGDGGLTSSLSNEAHVDDDTTQVAYRAALLDLIPEPFTHIEDVTSDPAIYLSTRESRLLQGAFTGEARYMDQFWSKWHDRRVRSRIMRLAPSLSNMERVRPLKGTPMPVHDAGRPVLERHDSGSSADTDMRLMASRPSSLIRPSHTVFPTPRASPPAPTPVWDHSETSMDTFINTVVKNTGRKVGAFPSEMPGILLGGAHQSLLDADRVIRALPPTSEAGHWRVAVLLLKQRVALLWDPSALDTPPSLAEETVNVLAAIIDFYEHVWRAGHREPPHAEGGWGFEMVHGGAHVLPIPEHLGDVKERSEDRDMTLSRRCRAGIAFFATASDDEVDKCVQSCLVAVTEA